MLTISSSKATTARSCWQKYKFKYIDGLNPKKRSSALSLGSIMHECFDKHYKGADTKTIIQFINNSFDQEMAALPLPEQEDVLLNKFTALGMWLYYPNKHLTFQEINSEMEFEVRLGNLRGVRFIGRVDGDVKQNNTYWIRDVKITGLSLRQFQGRISTSYQATGYIYAMRKLTGRDIKGVFFDCIKRPMLRKGKNETAEQFGRRIMDDYGNPKKQAMYFTRHYVYRTQKDIDRYLVDMTKLTREIRTRGRKNDWYRNPDSCWSYNTECPYKKICFTDSYDDSMIDLYYTRTRSKGRASDSKTSALA